MRFKEIQEATLSSGTDDKYLPVIQSIISDGDRTFQLGSKGDQGTFIANPGQRVANRLQILNGTIDGKPANIKVNQIFKTPAMVAMVRGQDPSKSASADKESHIIKPSQIFADEKFPATKVFDEVIGNGILQESEIGKYIIEMAKQIRSGSFPDMKNVPKQFHTAIRDYAGEYLGVLALIKGIANFPTRDAWLEHLNASNLNDITIYFPPESNNPLGDSEGYFQNRETGNIILISSKGGKKGAPPSVTGLKIPENLKTQEYALEVDVIETLQNLPAFEGPFVALNKIYEANPRSVDPTFAATLPLSNEEIRMIKEFTNRKLYNRRNVIDLPEKFRKIIGKGPDTKLEATPGGILHYAYSSELLKAVNQRNALPNFEPMAREILQKNFIQIFARPKGGNLTFDILWPNKEMATGKIELYNKSSSTDIKGKLSFSVT
jgi:hypothetical protein